MPTLIQNHSTRLPRETYDSYEPTPFAVGTRMLAHRGLHLSNKVIRVPFRTEDDLIIESGRDDKDPRMSRSTRRDIELQDVLVGYLNGHVESVLPSPAPDTKGNMRTYSLQRFVDHTGEDVRHFAFKIEAVKNQFRDFVTAVLTMVDETGVIPDFMGTHNVVVAKVGGGRKMIKLVDVNNVQPVLSRGQYSNCSDAELANILEKISSYQARPSDLKAALDSRYFDDKNIPIADESLQMLQNWLRRLGMNDELKHPVFEALTGQRSILLNFFSAERSTSA
jgi:hypothetical protein